MWYQIIHFHSKDPRFATGVGYAESRNGLIWNKPLRGISHPIHGRTNIVITSQGRSHLCSPSVVCDPEAVKAERYKMIFFDAMSQEELLAHGSPSPASPSVPGWRGVEGEGMFVCTSPDGIRWQRPPLPRFSGPNDVVSVSRATNGLWLAAYKTSLRHDRHFRIIETATSNNGFDWTPAAERLEPDWRDPFGTEFYGMCPFEYFGNYLGFLCVYRNSPDDKTLDIQLVTGEDGHSWQRAADRAALLSPGGRNQWDAGGLYIASSPLLPCPGSRDPIMLYYSGISTRHDDMRYREWSIGVATLRQDGFASLDAGPFIGELVTRPMLAAGNQLVVNLSCRHGAFKLRVIDADTGELLGSAKPIEGRDEIADTVKWERKRRFNGRYVRLIAEMRKARFYSFWFEP